MQIEYAMALQIHLLIEEVNPKIVDEMSILSHAFRGRETIPGQHLRTQRSPPLNSRLIATNEHFKRVGLNLIKLSADI